MSEYEKVLEFEKKEREILSDERLSQDGKNKAIQELRAKKAQYKSQAVSNLKYAVTGAKASFKEAENKLSQALEDVDKRWSFDRLNYYARVISGEFESAEDVRVASSIYEKHKNSNNRNAQRVASEVGSHIVKKRFGNSAESGDLLILMRSDLENLTKSEEVEEAKSGARQATEKLLGVIGDLERVKSAYSGDGAFSGKSEFDELLSGTRVKRTFGASFDKNKFESVSVEVD